MDDLHLVSMRPPWGLCLWVSSIPRVAYGTSRRPACAASWALWFQGVQSHGGGSWSKSRGTSIQLCRKGTTGARGWLSRPFGVMQTLAPSMHELTLTRLLYFSFLQHCHFGSPLVSLGIKAYLPATITSRGKNWFCGSPVPGTKYAFIINICWMVQARAGEEWSVRTGVLQSSSFCSLLSHTDCSSIAAQ